MINKLDTSVLKLKMIHGQQVDYLTDKIKQLEEEINILKKSHERIYDL